MDVGRHIDVTDNNSFCDSMNEGKSSQLGKHGFESLRKLT